MDNKVVASGVLATGVLALTMVMPSAAFASPAASELAASVRVTPPTGLSTGDEVTVSVDGFGTGDQVYAVQCGHASETASACNWEWAVPVTVNEAGAGDAVLAVKQVIQDGEASVDCAVAAGTCFVLTFNESESSWASAAIAFAPAA
jgi:protein involved in polysaccharide export with SLBB domain